MFRNNVIIRRKEELLGIMNKLFSSSNIVTNVGEAASVIRSKSKTIEFTKKKQREILSQKPNYIENMRMLKVAIIGAPNAGKSTLANKIINWKFSSVSGKVHTTRHKTLGVLTEKNKQVVFLDTPGVIVPSKLKKHNLETSLLVDPHQALHESDLIIVVVDVSNLWHRTHLEDEIMKMLIHHSKKQSILVLNKVDLLKTKEEVLNTVRVLTMGHLNGQEFYCFDKRKSNSPLPHSEFLQILFNKMKKENNSTNASSDMNSSLKEKEVDDNIKSHTCNVVNNSYVKNNEKCETSFFPTSNFITTSHPTQPSSIPESSSVSLVMDCDDNEKIKDNEQKINLYEKDQWLKYYSKLAEIGRNLKNCHGWPYFKEVFMVSAINGDGIYELKNFLLETTKPAKWLFNEQVITNQNPIQLACDIVWEKLLNNLPEEIPYQIKVKLVMWHIDENDDLLRAQFELFCNKKRHIQKVLGKNGFMIQKISSEIKQELMNAFKREMTLQIIVRGTSKLKPPLKQSDKSFQPQSESLKKI